MSDLRNQLDAAMGDPPRSTVDVDAIVRRQRRTGRLRVAGAAGATAAVLAGVTAGAVALSGTAPARLPSGSGPATATAAAPTTGPATTPTTPRCADGRPASGLPPGAGPRLTTALQAAVRAEIGRTKLYPFDDNGTARAPLRFFGGPCDPQERNRGEYLAVAKFGPRLLDPMLDVYVQTSTLTLCNERRCDERTGPGGELIQSVTERGEFQATQEVRAVVVVTKPDGTVVQLLAFTQDRTTGQPPLTVAQLIRIGLSPGLSLSR